MEGLKVRGLLVLLLSASLATTGCMSIHVRAAEGDGHALRIFPGAALDFVGLREGSGYYPDPVDNLCCLLDLPLSLAVDLVMLPVDIIWGHGDPPHPPRTRPAPEAPAETDGGPASTLPYWPG